MYMDSFIRYNVYLSPQQLQALQRVYDIFDKKISRKAASALRERISVLPTQLTSRDLK